MSGWWERLPGRRPLRDRASDARPAEAHESRPSGARVRRVTLGVDFGTATTKCCFREQGDRKPFFAIGHEPSSPPASRLLMPATVAYLDGKLFFGYQAEAVGAPTIIRSFKMCLLCQARAQRAESTHTAIAQPCPNCLEERPGHFRIAGTQPSAEDLSTLYLAVVLKVARERVAEVLEGDDHELRWSVHSAAPLDQMGEFGEVGDHFDRTLHYAWKLAVGAQNPWGLNDALEALRQARREPKPPLEMSPTRVFPETHAAMTAYLLLPQTQKGLYGSVDIGAGTTDVAFFWLQKDERETKAWYYAAGSRRYGMDDVDRALAPELRGRGGNLRAAREALSGGSLRVYQQHIEPIAKKIFQHHAAVLNDAMTIDQRHWAWFSADGIALYRLFLVGGGSTCDVVTERLRTSPPRHAGRWQDAPCTLGIPASTKVALPGGTIVALHTLNEPVAAKLCLLAYGLSHPRPDIPKYERDADGVRVEPPKVREYPVEPY